MRRLFFFSTACLLFAANMAFGQARAYREGSALGIPDAPSSTTYYTAMRREYRQPTEVTPDEPARISPDQGIPQGDPGYVAPESSPSDDMGNGHAMDNCGAGGFDPYAADAGSGCSGGSSGGCDGGDGGCGYGGRSGAYSGFGGFGGGSDCCWTAYGMGGNNSPWYLYGGVVAMTRDRGNKRWTTYETNNNPNQLLHTQQASGDWGVGGEIRVGRRFGCYSAAQFDYWSFDSLENTAGINSPTNTLSTPFDLGNVNLGTGLATDFFDNASEHFIYRRNEVHNVEATWLYAPGVMNCSRLQMTWLGGFRFLRFDENLSFDTVQGGAVFGQNGGLNQAELDVDVDNYYIGAQIGARAQWTACNGFFLYGLPKVGIYGHHMRNQDILARGDGFEQFNYTSTKNDLAVISQLDLGGGWQFCRNWALIGGYRVVSISGVALADNQIPFFWAAQDEFQDIDSNGHVLLHGAFAGLQCNF